jgi:hypothetical protein
MLKAIKLLTCIREVNGSNLGPATLTVLTEVSRGILHPFQANWGVVPQIMPHSIPVASFPLIILPFDPVILVTDSVAKSTANQTTRDKLHSYAGLYIRIYVCMFVWVYDLVFRRPTFV